MRSLSTKAMEDNPYSARFHLCSSVEGLRMNQTFSHTPVMLKEVLDFFSPIKEKHGWLIDATLGGAGHAEAILKSYPGLSLLGLDQDQFAVEAATTNLESFSSRVIIKKARFDEISDIARAVGVEDKVLGILMDLGLSSPQIDLPERGFSYSTEGPLDMRMDTTSSRTASSVINEYDQEDLIRLFRLNGERQLAKRIACAIIKSRPITTTTELASVVEMAVPRSNRRRGHPAKRVFQAVRIAVNQEIEVLRSGLEQAIDLLSPTGRLVVISYHSGEDQLVKQIFRDAGSGGCQCPYYLPCVCGAIPKVKVLTTGSRKATSSEISSNSRSSSARLRCVEGLDLDIPSRLGSIQ